MSKKLITAVTVCLVSLPLQAGPSARGASSQRHAVSPGLAGLPDVAERAVLGVVNISARRRTRKQSQVGPFFNDPFFQFFGPPQQRPEDRAQREQSLGSGVIVRRTGLVLTNFHVIKDTEGIQVTLKDGRSFDCKVVGSDPESDLAVLRMHKPPKDLRPIPMGNSDSLRLGAPVLAVGNPFGLGHTVTMGIVSAKGRGLNPNQYEDFIQTDAAINPGNSGGALLDFQGRLVGINTAIFSRTGGYQGIGFAIPVNMVKNVMSGLLKSGRVIRGYLGIRIDTVDNALAKALGLKRAGGVLIRSIEHRSPAEKGGLKAGDVVLELAGKRMPNARVFRNRIAAMGKGGVARMLIQRGKRTLTRQVKLGERPDLSKLRPGMGQPKALPGAKARPKGRLDGLVLEPLNKGSRQRYRVPARIHHGLIVTGVGPGSAAARAGFQEGDVIIEVNRKRVRTQKDFNSAYKASSSQVLILVQRDRRTRFLMLRK